MFCVRVCYSPERPVPAVFGVFIHARRLPCFITCVGLNRRPEEGTKGCSFDCRCKDKTFSGRMQAFTLTFYVRKAISSCNTKDKTFSGRMQAFTLTFYVRKAISSCNTISSIGFLSELYCRNNQQWESKDEKRACH